MPTSHDETLQQRYEREHRDFERTVASIPDADLLRRGVRNVVQQRPKRQEFAWAAVAQAFGLGSTFSAQLCTRFGIDPDTGKDLKFPTTPTTDDTKPQEAA